MTKVSISCEIFEYDELPEKTKERLLQETWEGACEIYRADHLEDSFKERVAQIGFTDVELSYDYRNSQGDGAVFEASIDVKKICKNLGIKYKSIWEGALVIERPSRGVHKESRHVVDLNEGTRQMCPESLVSAVEELRMKLCDEFFDELVADFEMETSKENLLKLLRSRKYSIRNELETALAKASQSEVVDII